jgi:ribonuclease-3 family protein
LTLDQSRQLSPAALAYVGDAVYELWVRLNFLIPRKQMQEYHQCVVAQVRAENQAALLEAIAPILTEAELTIVRRGRNSVTKSPKRLEHRIYRQATAFEALVGYLYLTDTERLMEIFDYMKTVQKISGDFSGTEEFA